MSFNFRLKNFSNPFSMPMISPLLLMFLTACAVSPRNMMTQDERVYWDSIKSAEETTKKELQNVGDFQSDSPETIVPHMRETVRIFKESFNKYTSSINSLSPPPLFVELHASLQDETEAITIFSKKSSNVFLEVAQNFDDYQNGKLSKSRSKKLFAIQTRKIEIILAEFKAAGSTITSNHERILVKVQLELKRRGQDQPSLIFLGAFDSSFFVSYQPELVPLEIQIDSNGSIQLSSKMSIPTPIGVFSLGSSMDFKSRKTLRILQADKVSIYDMGDKIFSIDLKNIEGNVKVTYDGKENIIITISS